MEHTEQSGESHPPGHKRVESELFKGTLDFDGVIEQLKSMANPARFTILYYLFEDGQAESATLATALDRHQNYLYHHLNELEDAGLVQKRRTNGTSVYELTPLGKQVVQQLVGAIRERAK